MDGGIKKSSKSRYVRVTKKCRAYKKELVTLLPEQLKILERDHPQKIITVTYYKKIKSNPASTVLDIDYERQLKPFYLDPSMANPFYRDPFLRLQFLSTYSDGSNGRDPRLRYAFNVPTDPRLQEQPPSTSRETKEIVPVASTSSREIVPVASTSSREIVPVASTSSREVEIDVLYEGENPEKVLDSITLEDSDDDDNLSCTDSTGLSWNEEYEKFESYPWNEDYNYYDDEELVEYDNRLDDDSDKNILDIIFLEDDDDDSLASSWSETIV